MVTKNIKYVTTEDLNILDHHMDVENLYSENYENNGIRNHNALKENGIGLKCVFLTKNQQTEHPFPEQIEQY